MNTAIIRTLLAALCVGLLSLLVPASQAGASLIFTMPSGSTAGGQPVSGQVTFTLTNNNINILIENFQANPGGVIQCISDLKFTLDMSAAGSTVTSQTSNGIDIASGGSYTSTGAQTLGWSITTSGGQIYLNGLASGPSETIIGPPDGSNVYSNANSSIAGNGPHNPFSFETGTFNVNLPGVTDQTMVTAATLSFGTTAGTEVPLIPPFTPEPATMLLLAAGGVGVLVTRRRKV
jgi:hypothetical protein